MPIVKLPGGATAIVCTRERVKPCVTCGRASSLLCDYPVTRNGKPGTCDRAICRQHSERVGEDKDYCLAHAEQARKSGECNV